MCGSVRVRGSEFCPEVSSFSFSLSLSFPFLFLGRWWMDEMMRMNMDWGIDICECVCVCGVYLWSTRSGLVWSGYPGVCVWLIRFD